MKAPHLCCPAAGALASLTSVTMCMMFMAMSMTMTMITIAPAQMVSSLKLNPKVVTASLSPNHIHMNRSNGQHRSNGHLPSAFIQKLLPEPVPTSSKEASTAIAPPPPPAVALAQQLIVTLSLLNIASQYLVPCTKKAYKFTSEALGNATKEFINISKSVAACVTQTARKVPSQTTSLFKTMSTMCENICDVSTTVVTKCIGAIVDFTQHVACGFVDSVRGVEAWIQTACSSTYRDILMPLVRNTSHFIATVSEDITAWIEDVALFTSRLLTTVALDCLHFVTNFALDSADFLKHYSILTYAVGESALIAVALSIFQIILNIPVWITDVTYATLEFVSMIIVKMKLALVGIYIDFLDLVEKSIDAAPFLERYAEEDGTKKVCLTPKAQMILYLLSTIYAAQPFLEEGVDVTR